jgi:4-diphosphocytidyl-2-C-methyl-D-erythritol kinase
MELAARLGSDVPFFLLGGTALGLGRGEEVYPLPDLPKARGLIVAPEIHVATADAYRALNRPVTCLTSSAEYRIISNFQSRVWSLSGSSPVGEPIICENDFEEVVFARHPRLKAIKSKLLRLGARPAMLTGSGAALFGLFHDSDQWKSAAAAMGGLRIFPVSLINRPAYRSMWWKQLRAHIAEGLWPPRGPFVE